MSNFLPKTLSLLAATTLQMNLLAEETILQPVADTTIHEFFPENNFGQLSHVAAGTIREQNGSLPRTRGLFKFDLSSIPPNANITSAKLTLQVTFSPPGGAASNFGLHRVTTAWSEGTKVGNGGQPAEDGESTWHYSARPTAWQIPGGDFIRAASGLAAVPTGAGPIIWQTEGTMEDVRFWHANPSANHGWLLKSDDETIEQTAKRWGSNEALSTDNNPRLEIQWQIDLPDELRITDIEQNVGTVALSFLGAQRVMVQRKLNIDQPWETLPTEFSSSPIVLPASEGMAFYRLISTP